MDATIRPATRADSDAIAEIHVAAWEGAYRRIVPDEEFAKRPIERRRLQWRTWLENSEHITLVACAPSADILGFAGSRLLDLPVNGFDSYLATLYLRPDCKRQGLGKALLQATARELCALGAKNLVLRTLRLGPGRAFYERCGARFLAEGIDVDAGHFDDVAYAFDDLQALIALR